MDILVVLLLFVALICFVLGLIYPKIFKFIFRSRTNRKMTSLVFGGASILFFILLLILSIGTPRLQDIKSPTNQKTQRITGTDAFKNSQIKIYLNNELKKEMKANNKGAFSAEFELIEGSNKFKASATNDKNKTKTSSEIEMVLDTIAPKLTLEAVPALTENETLEIKGESETGVKILIVRDNKGIKDEKIKDSKFTISGIKLNAGDNKLSIFAIDEAGNKSEEKVVVVKYNPKATETPKTQVPAKTPEPTPTPPSQSDNQNTSPVSNETVSQKNAVKSAKSYIGYTAFSHDGLVAQLEYEQFSHADAVYGADNSGANWNEQAAKSAKQYMDYSAFSRGSLIAQLEYDKFTQEQAEFGANAVGL